MNLEFKKCRECPVKCELEDGGVIIVDNFKNGSSSVEAAGNRISVLSQRAGTKIGCPPHEIARIRRLIADQIGDPKLKQRIKNTARFFLDPAMSETEKPSFPLGFNRPGERTYGKDRK